MYSQNVAWSEKTILDVKFIDEMEEGNQNFSIHFSCEVDGGKIRIVKYKIIHGILFEYKKRTYKIVVYIFLYELRKGEDAISPSPCPYKSHNFLRIL